jgi:hypothetical protein
MGIKTFYNPTTRDVVDKPGPGMYNHYEEIGRKHGPKAVIGRASRYNDMYKSRNDSKPGPGEYTLDNIGMT